MAALAVFRFASRPISPDQPLIQKCGPCNRQPVSRDIVERKIAPQQKSASKCQPESIDGWHTPQSAELDHRRYSRSETGQTNCTQSWKANCNEPIQRHRPQRRSAILKPKWRKTEGSHPPSQSSRNCNQQQYCISNTTFRYRHRGHRLVPTSFRVYREDGCISQQDYPVESNRRIKPYEIVWLRRAD